MIRIPAVENMIISVHEHAVGVDESVDKKTGGNSLFKWLAASPGKE
jgi:hypothetical protein